MGNPLNQIGTVTEAIHAIEMLGIEAGLGPAAVFRNPLR